MGLLHWANMSNTSLTCHALVRTSYKHSCFKKQSIETLGAVGFFGNHHLSLITYHSSFITYNLKYPNFPNPTHLAPNLVLFFNFKNLKMWDPFLKLKSLTMTMFQIYIYIYIKSQKLRLKGFVALFQK